MGLGFRLQAWIDHFSRIKGQVDYPRGFEYRVQLKKSWKRGDGLLIQFRVRLTERIDTQKNSSGVPIQSLSNISHQYFRVRWQNKVSRGEIFHEILSHKIEADGSDRVGFAAGTGLIQEFYIWQVSGRIYIFHGDDFSSRVYFYQATVPGVFGLYGGYGDGIAVSGRVKLVPLPGRIFYISLNSVSKTFPRVGRKVDFSAYFQMVVDLNKGFR
jgi:hypothetical protein